MHNPLAILTPELLDGLITGGHRYFIRQSFIRGKNPLDHETKEAFLITPYRDFSEVNAHLQAIKYDGRKYVYQIGDQWELDKLYIAARQPEGYKVFVALLREPRWKPPKMLTPKINNYLRAYTRWKPERGIETRVNLFMQFGELFLILQYKSEEIKVPLLDIEKL